MFTISGVLMMMTMKAEMMIMMIGIMRVILYIADCEYSPDDYDDYAPSRRQ